MSLRFLTTLRKFSTTRTLARPELSSKYKTDALWDERFRCPMLSDNEEMFKLINNKIMIGETLTNLELDIFINISSPRTNETAQLQESARLLKTFRRSIYAHTVLPSTLHAACRLFLDSQQLPSLLNMIHDRVNYGLFPDFFAINLIFDAALEKEDYAMASRVATHLMYQEDFGINSLTDSLALYSLSKYIESKTDFQGLASRSAAEDPVLAANENAGQEEKSEKESSENKKDEDDIEDEEEEDAQYIRIPFLRNPYFDNHFDLKSSRVICGKSFSLLGLTLPKNESQLALRSSLVGKVLHGDWLEAKNLLDECVRSKISLGPMKDHLTYYVENLHDLEGTNDNDRKCLMEVLSKVSSDGQGLSEMAEARFNGLKQEMEERDINEFKSRLIKWSENRFKVKKYEQDRADREIVIAKIKEKKEELKLREQYLYFYDNIKKRNLTKIEYN